MNTYIVNVQFRFNFVLYFCNLFLYFLMCLKFMFLKKFLEGAVV